MTILMRFSESCPLFVYHFFIMDSSAALQPSSKNIQHISSNVSWSLQSCEKCL